MNVVAMTKEDLAYQ